MTLTASDVSLGGPAHVLIDEALSKYPQYRAFRRGELSRADYCAWVGSGAAPLSETGLNEDQFNLSTRLPVNEWAYTERILEELADAGVIGSTCYPADEFGPLYNTVAATFRHGPYKTYIFPEEARLLFALAHILEPRRTVFPGSYYGYWAVWAMPGIIAAEGTATLVDINTDTMRRAQDNLRALGLDEGVDYVTEDAIAFGRALDRVDFCVLDAEGPKNAEDPLLRDKAIYEPIMRATSRAIRPGGVLLAHNMLLQNLTENRYFAGRIANNESQYAGFHSHLDEYYDVHAVYPTTEGVGVYRRSDKE
ncbi:O-methyltransferase [Streptomyces sp. DT171]|uniref:O-methyltransferase n=1 Tax=Streptomyces sp. DT171 TaxID=3416524 RepID=UPI003CF69E0E